MKRKFRILIFAFLVLISFQNISFSEDNFNKLRDERYACNLFYNKIENSEDQSARNMYLYFEEADFGFSPKMNYDDEKNKWEWFKDGTNIIVGSVYEPDSDYKLRSGVIIEKINGKNASDITDAGWYTYIDEVDTLELEIINLDKKPETIILKKETRDWTVVYHFIRDFKITNIDIKNSTYDLTIENTFEQRYDGARNERNQ